MNTNWRNRYLFRQLFVMLQAMWLLYPTYQIGLATWVLHKWVDEVSIYSIVSCEKRLKRDEGRTLRNDVQHDVDDSIACRPYYWMRNCIYFVKDWRRKERKYFGPLLLVLLFYVLLAYDNFRHQNGLKTKETPTWRGSRAPQVCHTTTWHCSIVHTKRKKVSTKCHD